MTFIRTTIGFAASLAAIGLLSACDKPKPRGETEATAAAPTAVAELPPMPAWAAEVIGKDLKTAFPGEGACDGNTDAVESRGQGAVVGASLLGWAWDPATKAPVTRVVLVDKDLKIVGAGETGLPRPDVRMARVDITSDTTGWRGVVNVGAGPIDAHGLVGDGTATCKLGHIEL